MKIFRDPRYGYVLETACLYLMLCLAGWLLNEGDWGFVDQVFHPFTLVIAIVGIRHGMTQAIFASVMGTILYVVAYMQARQLGLYELDLRGGFVAIFIMVFVAVVIGTTSEARNKRTSAVRSELEEVRGENQHLSQQNNMLAAANRELNERILGEVTTVQSFSDIARRLSLVEEEDLYPTICELVREYLHAEACSIYLLQGERLVLKAQSGWDFVPPEAESLEPGEDLLWACLRQETPMTALDVRTPGWADEADPESRYNRLICAPIMHPHLDKAMGVLSVDRMPFTRFHGASVKVLGVIAKWAGDALYNAALFRQLNSQLVGDEVMERCVPPLIFHDRLREAVPRNGGLSSLVALRMKGYGRVDSRERQRVAEGLYQVLEPLLSDMDVLGRIREGHYGVLLRGRDQEQATRFRDRLIEGIRNRVKVEVPAAREVTFVVGALQLKPSDAEEETERLIHAAHQNGVIA